MIVAKCAVVKCDQCDTPMFLMLESQKSQKYNVKVKDIKVQSKRHVSLLSKSKSCIIKSKTAKRQNSKAKEVVVLLMHPGEFFCVSLRYCSFTCLSFAGSDTAGPRTACVPCGPPLTCCHPQRITPMNMPPSRRPLHECAILHAYIGGTSISEDIHKLEYGQYPLHALDKSTDA